MAYRKPKQSSEEYFELHQERKEKARAFYNAQTKNKIVRNMNGGRRK